MLSRSARTKPLKSPIPGRDHAWNLKLTKDLMATRQTTGATATGVVRLGQKTQAACGLQPWIQAIQARHDQRLMCGRTLSLNGCKVTCEPQRGRRNRTTWCRLYIPHLHAGTVRELKEEQRTSGTSGTVWINTIDDRMQSHFMRCLPWAVQAISRANAPPPVNCTLRQT